PSAPRRGAGGGPSGLDPIDRQSTLDGVGIPPPKRRARPAGLGVALNHTPGDSPLADRFWRLLSRMAPILFKIPLTLPFLGSTEIPVYGYGVLLVLAFVSSTWLAWWRCRREGLDPEVIPDMAFWVFLAGL